MGWNMCSTGRLAALAASIKGAEFFGPVPDSDHETES
jgi:hypothetical protein